MSQTTIEHMEHLNYVDIRLTCKPIMTVSWETYAEYDTHPTMTQVRQNRKCRSNKTAELSDGPKNPQAQAYSDIQSLRLLDPFFSSRLTFDLLMVVSAEIF